MNIKCYVNLVIISILFAITGCAGQPPDPSRAGCYKLDGTARYGTFTQYVKGKVKGVHIYIGEKLTGKVKVTCNMIKQEILYGTEPPYEDLPEWIEEEDSE